MNEPGRFPTRYLRLLQSQRAGRPGDQISFRVDGTDAGSLTRGKVLHVEQERDGDWRYVGAVVAARSADLGSQWIPAGSGSFAVTLEGYRATSPLYFEVPPLDPGEYRIRLDAVLTGDTDVDVRDRTATFYAPLRVLPPE